MDDPSTDTLRKLAPCWTLAGDERLLTILQNTHQRLLAKCQEANTHLDAMVTTLDDASISLQNVNNQFMALSSSQFIESRVYDDDADMAPDTPTVKESPKPSPPDELTVLKRSIAVIESTHEIITILNDSDTESDSDDELPDRLVLKPRDVYSERPLPYIIGSEPWKSKWHAGLMQEDSDTDSSTSKLDRESDQYSQSENEEFQQDTRQGGRLPVQHIRNISETSSDVPSEATPTNKPTPSDVASEIARRLGAGVPPPKMPDPEAEYEESPTPAVRKVYKPQEPVVSNIFSDSPPPLDASDSDTDVFAGLQRQQPYKQTNTYAPTDLFGDEDDSDDGDIFSDFAKQPPPTKPTSLFDAGPKPNMFNKPAALPNNVEQPGSRTHQQVDEHTVEASADDAKVASKKPIGGISLFGSNKGTESIGAAILKRNQRKSSTSGEDSENDVTEPPSPKEEQAKKQRDIFDDLFAKSESKKVKPKADNFVKEIKQTVQRKKEETVKKETPKVDLFNDNLFDDIDDIFTSTIVTSTKDKKDKPKSIFEDDDDLFSEIAEPKTVKPEVKNNSDSKKKGLFDSDDELFSEPVKNNPAISNKRATTPKIENATKICETSTKIHVKPNNNREPTKATKEISIFDDDEEDDLFSGIKTNKDNNVANKVQNASNAYLNQNVATSKIAFKSPSLFDDDDDSELFVEPAKSTKKIEKNIKVNKAVNTPNKDNLKQAVDHSTKDIFSESDSKPTDVKTIVEETKINTDLTPPISIKKDVLEEKTVKNYDKIVQEKTEIFKNDIQDIVDIEKSSEINNSDTTKESINTNNMNINTNSLAIHKLLADNDKMSDDEFSEQDFDDEPVQESKPDQNIISAVIPETVPEKIPETVPEKIPEIINSISKKPDLEAENLFSESTDSMPEIKDDKPEILSNVAEVPRVPDISKANTNAPSIFDNSPLDEDIFAPPSFIKSESDYTKTAENSTTDIDNNTAKDIFTDIITEPPAFEKPKEPKKSKNVNALFDDDSDDESLFFKKDDVISDEKPEDFTAKQDRLFGLFTDEPPDVDFTKINDDLDDDLFSTHPNPKLASESKSETSIEDNFDRPLPETPKLVDEIKHSTEKPIAPETSKMTDLEVKESFDDITQPEKEASRSPTVKELTSIFNDNILFKEPTSLISVADSQSVFSDDDEELFKSLPVHLSQPKTKIIPKHEESDEELYSSLPNLENTVPEPKLLDNKSIFKLPSEKPVKKEARKVGKLKLGLNINVNALLPGAAPRKVKTADNIDGQTQSQVESPKEDPVVSKTVGFDAKPESEILDNKLSKERPRIQVKRRPSSRKARIEAVRKSGNDFGEDSTDNSSSFDDPPKSQAEVIKKDVEISKIEVKVDDKEDIAKNIEENPLDRTKIEPKNTESDSRPIQVDIEAVNEDIPTAIEPVKPPVKSESTTKIKYILNDEDIFNTSPTENLLPKTTATVANENVTKTTDHFGSDSPVLSSILAKNTTVDSDIFGSGVAKNAENLSQETDSAIKTIGQTYKKTDEKKKSKSLFGEDENSDDEIFKNNKPAAKTNVFDSDSEGELFGVPKKVEKVDKVENIDKVEKKKVEVKGSLFGDDDDDDLFGVKTKKRTAEAPPQASRSTPAAKEPLKSAQPVFEDPLSMFGDDD